MDVVGCFNKYYDKLRKNYYTWSDTNLVGVPGDYGVPTIEEGLTYLKCNECGNTSFEVAKTNSYETSAKCTNCNKWFIVHAG